MRTSSYRQVEHTADLAIEVRGRTLADLFKNAVLAYYDLVCETEGVAAKKKLRFRIAADTPEDAFYQLLREVHYRQQAEGWLCRRVRVRLEKILPGPPFRKGGTQGGRPPLTPLWKRGDRGDLGVVRADLVVTMVGERYSPARHELKDEIKAVTLHGLRVSQTRRLGRTGWKAFVVFDV